MLPLYKLFIWGRLRAVSLFLQFFVVSAIVERQSCETRHEKRGWQPEKKKRDCPHSQSRWNMRWPHYAEIWLADVWSIDNELSTIEAIDELMIAEALQECLSHFPKIDALNARLIVLCETKQNEMKSVLCEMKLCTLRNENLYFTKLWNPYFAKWKSVLCEIAKWRIGSSYLRSWRYCNFADWFWKKPDFFNCVVS